MKILRKHVECGEYEFDVAVDRDIAIDVMEAFPDLCDYMFTKAKESAYKKEKKNETDMDFLMKNIREKKLHEMYKQEEELENCVKYAFPKMLKKAGSDLDANKIIDYIYENGVEAEFNAGMYEFILMGFTQREVAERKVRFSMS